MAGHVDDAILHGIARSVVMTALVEDPAVLEAFAELDAGSRPDLVETRLLDTLAEREIAWPWLLAELRLAHWAWQSNRGRPGWYAGRARGIVLESVEPATLAERPELPPLPAISPGMTESEALLELDVWHRRAVRAVQTVARRAQPGRRPSQASLEGIRNYTGWLVRRRLGGETIASIARGGLDETSSADPAERGSWIRDGIRRVDELLEAAPTGTLLAQRGETKDADSASLALPSALATEDVRMPP